MQFVQHALLIPAFKPTVGLLSLLAELRQKSSFPIIVVDDGSGPAHSATFDEASTIEGVTILRNAINLGKGAALKHGINYILLRFPDAGWIVTADADGQHSPADIMAVAEASEARSLVLGSREFGADVPLRSKFGNRLSAYIYRLQLRTPLRDTQTGLRSIPRPLAEQCLTIRSNRYEFETEQLFLAKKVGFSLKEKPIQTIYIDDNDGSHFNPILDSFRIYFVLARYGVSGAAAVATDLVVFFLLTNLASVPVVSANMIGFAIAGFVQFVILRSYVFKVKGFALGTFVAFVLYALVSRYVSAVLQTELTETLLVPPIVSKIVVDTSIFLINFLFLRDIVFRRWSDT